MPGKGNGVDHDAAKEHKNRKPSPNPSAESGDFRCADPPGKGDPNPKFRQACGDK